MKLLLLFLLLILTVGLAHALSIEQWSYNLKATDKQSVHEALSEKIIKARHACINKAEMGERLAIKKMGGTPLQIVLQDILDSSVAMSNQPKLPWYTVVEMQRIARDAYREKYDSTDDVDNFVLALYHTCLSNGG